jgi:hypothetical protein
VLVVNGLDVLDLILPADGEEVQQYVLAEVDRDRGLHRVGDLLVLGADVMGFTIGHRHMDPLEGKKKKKNYFSSYNSIKCFKFVFLSIKDTLESIVKSFLMLHRQIITHHTVIHLWVHKACQ